MASKKKSKGRDNEIRNAKAFRDYTVTETLEAGIMLTGTEVKSIRQGKAQINDSFARVEREEMFLYNAHIDEYSHGNLNNHLPTRTRKLLLHKKEIQRWRAAVEAGGSSIILLRLYFKEALVKAEIALCKGKKLYDKREDLKKKTQMRVQRAISGRSD
jgi:SsrA-binding protein